MNRDHVISLIDPANTPSIRVADAIGETLEREVEVAEYRLLMYGKTRTDSREQAPSGATSL